MKFIKIIFLSSILIFSSIIGQDIKKTVLNSNIEKLNNSKLIKTNIVSSDYLDQKIDPIIKLLISELKTNKVSSTELVKKYNSHSKVIAVNKNKSNQLSVAVFIKSDDVSLTKIWLESEGVVVRSIIKNIIVATIPVLKVTHLAEREEVLYVEGSKISKPALNVSHVEVGANAVHTGSGLPQAYKGDNVVVGVVDSGIDWEHEDFDNGSGSRIQFLWDMSGSSGPPLGYSYGTEYTKAQIDLGQVSEVDADDGGGHGTHVSATAAGKDNAQAGYTGLAPNSDIVFVKGFRSGPGFADADVVDGCSYIFQKAQAMGKPAVINLSLGGQFGAHDGTSLNEQSLSNLTGPGKIIVVAAGNAGADQIHLSYATGGSSTNDARRTFWVISQGTNFSLADMWYSSGNISVGIAAYDAQLNLLGLTNPVAPGQKVENLNFDIGAGNILGVVSIDASTVTDPNNGASRVLISIDDNNGTYDLSAVFWTIYTFGTGTFDAWMVTSGNYFTTDSDPGNLIFPGDNNKSLGMPSTALKVICVGSYVTKNQWVDIDGITRIQGGNPIIGNISSFSSLGPTRDNRMKPDLSAPGEAIIAAMSGDLTIGPTTTPRTDILLGGKHKKFQGTSMACPHVTGTVALMLQRNPSLDYNQTINILTTTARKDNFTGATANNTYGNGKLDAHGAVLATTGGGPGPVTVLAEAFEGSFPPGGWTTQILNASNTWLQGNPVSNNFNTIDPTSTASAICPWVAENQDEWLISPVFSLGGGSASLGFYAGYSTAFLGFATLKLHISTNGGTNWAQIWEAENDGGVWGWRQKTVDLSAYAGQQNLKIGWQYVGNDGDLVGLDAINLTGTLTDVNDEITQIPTIYSLSQNYPNPFNPVTTIQYSIPEQSYISIYVYDILGSVVSKLVDEEKTAGYYEVQFGSTKLSSGVYFVRINSEKFTETKKMILLK